MSVVRNFDYRPVAGDPSLRDRLRGVLRSPRLLVAATIATLLVLAGVGPLVLLAVVRLPTEWGVLALLAALALMGVYVWGDALHQGGEGTGLAAFAEANDLVLVEGVSAREYAGSLFHDGEHVVEAAVRTREADFVEVGDSFTLAAVTMRDVRAVHDGRGTVRSRAPQAYLRARLAGGSAHPPQEGVHVSPAVYADLRELLGEHTVEITRTELTVLGSAPLGLGDPDRLREAFRLVDALAAENARDVPSGVVAAGPQERRRRRSPVAVVLGTLALVVVVPLVFAAVMGGLVPAGGVPGGKGGLIAVVAIAVLLAVTSAGVRFLLVGRRDRASGSAPEPDEPDQPDVVRR